MKYDLSILIPSRNEMWLAKTIQDILEHKEGKTEVIVGLDGQWADPGIEDHPDVTIVYCPESIGQRGMTNQLARLSDAKYIMKVDAHCAFDKGFDVKMMADIQDNWTMVPTMRNLHVFDWVCPEGHRRYQGPSGLCIQCGERTERDVVWIPKKNPQSNSYCFDAEPHFQYFGEFNKRPEGLGEITPTMSLQGSCFIMTRAKYWELGICDESFGSWGSQGIEVACKTWLSGGKVMVNHNTWYAHLFRTQGGDFGMPYPNPQSKIEEAKSKARDLFFNNKWDKAIYPMSWLIEKFWPIKNGDKIHWTYESLKQLKENESFATQGIIFYTDNQLNLKIAHKVQKQLSKVSQDMNIQIVSSSLKPMIFGTKNICLPLERGYITMFKQILAALEASTANIIFFCEHDVLYHKSHFDFMPPRRDTFYYNVNVWKLRDDGMALWVDNCRQVSGLCGYREELIKHYKERVEKCDKIGYNRDMGFEPGTHGRIEWNNKYTSENRMSEYPNIDIRHNKNLTPNRWSPNLFRDKRNCQGWTESYEISGWGKTNDILK